MNDVYYNPETGKTHFRRKKNTYGCGRSGWFAGHHGSTHSAFKFPSDVMSRSWCFHYERPDKPRRSRSRANQEYRKRHNRKSRYFFRNEIRKLVLDEESKL